MTVTLSPDIFNESKIDAELASRHLINFTEYFWPQIEPVKPFINSWAIAAIADHLEACINGQIKRLVINVPPRFAKSTITSVMLQPWAWIRKPGLRMLYGSYSLQLATRDTVRARRIIASQKYQANWGARFALAGDQNTKTRFENDKTGLRVITAVDAATTGEGGDVIVVDDPHNVKDAYSKTAMESANRWFKESLLTRRNSDDACIIVIMQRISEDDLSGQLLSGGGWDRLILPMEWEGEHRSRTFLDFHDPRANEGELLCQDLRGADELAALKGPDGMGSVAYSGQFQQSPKKAGGNILRSDWWRYYKELPPDADRVELLQSWDTALKSAEQHDFWGFCEAWRTKDGRLYFTNVFKKRMEAPEGRRMIRQLYEHADADTVLVEEKSSGGVIVQDLKTEGVPVKPIMPKGDKVERANIAAVKLEAGFCFLPEGAPWVYDFINETATFPNVKHDDRTDAATQLINYAFRRRVYAGVVTGETPKDENTADEAITTADLVAVPDEFFGEDDNGFI